MAAKSKGVIPKNNRRSRLEKYYRRSPFLVSYWKENQLLFENYLTGKVIGASAETAAVLDYLGNWKTVDAMSRQWPDYTAKSLRSSVQHLAQQTLLEQSSQKDQQQAKQVQALQNWRAWNPAASFFHLTTKDAYSDKVTKEEIQYIEGLMQDRSASRSLRKFAKAKVVKLRSNLPASEFSKVLQERRTWRQFSPAKVKADSFSSLMNLSFAVQNWERIPKSGKLPLKTSPSGGALHPLEAYALVRKVEGIEPGIYHYDEVGCRLQEVQRGATANEIQKYLAGQWWFRDAAFVVFLTAVFARTQWKYDYARAYRAILIEAGHLCQTFCLTATWLGLAPFCTIAMKDTAIEKALRVDGISESVIYAMGAGVRPTKK